LLLPDALGSKVTYVIVLEHEKSNEVAFLAVPQLLGLIMKGSSTLYKKMQRELGKTVTDFPELRLMALDFYVENRDSLPDDLSGDEVLEFMRKSDTEFWKNVRRNE
jgi:hypothetical protein